MALGGARKRAFLWGFLLVTQSCAVPAMLAQQLFSPVDGSPQSGDKTTQPSTSQPSALRLASNEEQPSQPSADHSSSPQARPAPSMFDPNSGETKTLEEADRRAARDNLFVKYLLLSCATIGAIIAFVVWRSMPPKPKANTEGN
jgi:hypothetical protein